MGYELHICHTPDWLDAETQPVSREQWDSVVSADPELRVSTDDYFEFRAPDGSTVRVGAVVWHRHGNTPFWFQRGEITVKNPDDATVVKALELAGRLRCFVVGDDHEQYALQEEPPGWRATWI